MFSCSGRLRMKLSSMMITFTLVMVASGSGVGKAWDVSPSMNSDSHRLSWPRFDASPLEVRTISGVGRLPQQFKVDFGMKPEPENLDLSNQRKSRRKEVFEDDELDFERSLRESKPIANSLDFSKFEEISPLDDNFKFYTIPNTGTK